MYDCTHRVESAASHLGNRHASFVDNEKEKHRLLLDDVLHLPRLKEELLLLRAVGKAGFDFVGKNDVLVIGDGLIGLVPKGKWHASKAYHLPTSFPTRLFEDPPSVDVSAKAVIAPGDPYPREIDENIFHASYKHAHERLLKKTKQKVGVILTGKLRTCQGCAVGETCVTLYRRRRSLGLPRSLT